MQKTNTLHNSIKMVAFDLDGTLLNQHKNIGDADLAMLHKLGSMGIIRVACTGRNLFSINRLFKPDFPFDYLVFSTGAGIYDWRNKSILTSWLIDADAIAKTVDKILTHNLSFTINLPIPNNHNMLWHHAGIFESDLRIYTTFYKDYVTDINLEHLPKLATQFIVLLNNRSHYTSLGTEFSYLKTVLTTSPVNHSSFWLELFNPEVSKGNGLYHLCQRLGIEQAETFGIGNDYNDLDMLNFTANSYVVANAPDDMKQHYKVTSSHNDNGFSKALLPLL